MANILIIEDEEKVLEVVQAYLEKDNHTVSTALDGAKGLDLFFQIQPDLLILDLMLPTINGEEICKEVRKQSDLPIIMLTAKSTVDDRISGLQLGADDYLIKPFSPRELVVRVQTLLRRVKASKTISPILKFNHDDLIIHTTEHRVYKNNVPLNLTGLEYKFLIFFAVNPNKVFSREALIDKVLGIDYNGYDRTIDAHIKNIRKKIETNPKKPEYIKTVFGIGYRFEGEKNENHFN
ncbi:DNA-binding response OmpR family regulator [Natranaerovirga hydrolytica]|uniref:Stage 0 sporulation protein A homolog n=1 Tax=Natranaerovirga hydrolytica TaxID=680378 RepID=A0A4R1MLI9_9FIRM|nr:response regulator transcription factor [Natranaerovirga hydrolytica]TCK92722.1 DNA-binding response OmpR family regulator [Natranaerovirga hydrolytica]